MLRRKLRQPRIRFILRWFGEAYASLDDDDELTDFAQAAHGVHAVHDEAVGQGFRRGVAAFRFHGIEGRRVNIGPDAFKIATGGADGVTMAGERRLARFP